ncbi:MAG: hypothetical protein LUE64_04735 [Candidatus Gastranaerophilales bacterium]|nr:hypothetical protein [Candidatus Gastranaerophilales bacterium]
MSYRYDHELVIANKYGAASSLAKAEMYETYDRLRDITVSGSTATGSGFGSAGGFLWQLASMFSPSSFSTIYGGSSTLNIPGTSYWSPVTGSTSSIYGSNSSFGIGSIGSYSGFPSGAAPVSWSLGSLTGGAAGVSTGYATSASSIAGLTSAAYGVGLASTGFNFGETIILPTAGLISGLGGIMQSMAPYLGTSGLAAIVAGNIFEGTGSAALSAYQNLTGRVTTNADTILSNKVRNIETVVKMLDTQADIVRQSLKDSIESDNDAISDIS